MFELHKVGISAVIVRKGGCLDGRRPAGPPCRHTGAARPPAAARVRGWHRGQLYLALARLQLQARTWG